MVSTNEMGWPEGLAEMALAGPVLPPEPVENAVLKVASRCNLDCHYCYVYHMADQTWRERPLFMDEEVVAHTALRFAEHAEKYGQEKVSLTFHGGEPLLYEQKNPDFYPWTTSVFKNIIGGVIGKDNVRFSMQTNGTLITPDILDKMLRLGIRIGVSMDGATPTTHNVARTYRNGKGSYAETRRGLELLQQPRYKEIYGGIITVVNPLFNPVHVYHGLKAFFPPRVDLLLPLGDWDKPPPYMAEGQTSYADWLITVYDNQRADPNPMPIRLFTEITNMLLGRDGSAEYLGNRQPRNVVIETDGGIELVDAYKSVAHGAPATGLTVFENSFNDLLDHYKLRGQRLGRLALADKCLSCDVVDTCGNGFRPHRYRQGSQDDGFRNPSVYCDDLQKLIRHIDACIKSDLRKAGLRALAGEGT